MPTAADRADDAAERGRAGGGGGPPPPPRLTELSEAARTRALERVARLRPFLEDGAPLAQAARAEGLPLRTAWRWVQRYRRAGLGGLVRRPRADRDRRRRLVPDVERCIEGLALRRPPLTAAAVHREVARLATERGWPVPSYRTVAAVVHRLEPALVTLAHAGPRAYRERFDLLYRREAGRPNAVWQADHTPLDPWVRDARGRPARPWLTAVLDDSSRAVAGYALSLRAPSALQTALALRQAIWRKADPRWHVCGVPDVCYTDHGSDFTSHHLEQVAADLPMALVFSTPGVPRGRGKIERFFATVTQLFLCHQPGSTPPGTRPPAAATGLLPLAALDARSATFVVETYHARVHGETGVAPQARWEADGFLPRLPESLEQLDLLLLTVARPRRRPGYAALPRAERVERNLPGHV